MFKYGSVEQELFENMKNNLLSIQNNNKYNFGKLANAAVALNKAANIFDKIGLENASEELTQILEDVQNIINERNS